MRTQVKIWKACKRINNMYNNTYKNLKFDWIKFPTSGNELSKLLVFNMDSNLMAWLPKLYVKLPNEVPKLIFNFVLGLQELNNT